MSTFTQVISSGRGRSIRNERTYSLKDPSANHPMLSGMLSVFNDSGVSVTEKTAITLSAVWRCVNILAGAIATQPKHAFRRSAENRKKKQVAREHSAHRVIYQRPNNYQNSFQFHYMMVVYLLLWGNFYAFISRNAFYEPVSLRPVPPWKVTVKMENGNKVFYIDGTSRRFTSNEMLHVYGMSLDGLTGLNPVRYNAQSIGLGIVSKKFQSSAFGHGTNPGGVLTFPDEEKGLLGSTDEEVEQHVESMRRSLEKTYNGPENFHKWLLLEPGFKFEQFKLNLENAQLIEAMKYNVADIARMYGVPLHKVMELDRATHSNIEHQGIEFVQDGVLPLTTNIEHEYNTKLFRETEKDTHYVKINLDGLMRADIKNRYDAYSIALGKNAPGWMEPSEIRDLEDLGEGNPDNWAIPQNMNLRGQRTDENQNNAA